MRVKGRSKGVRLMKLVDPQHLLLDKPGKHDEVSTHLQIALSIFTKSAEQFAPI
ncbi:MAG TPA: hypothetical protein VFM79_02915 [Pelobium sp.]|nr:hypothetical protein [Pelobium sp.]